MSKKPFDPKSTVFTNLALDEIMPRVSGNAWKVICLAIRKTAGWIDDSTYSGRKESDVISVSQFEKLCGFGRHTAIDAINECLRSGYLIRTIEGRSFRYRLNMNFDLDLLDNRPKNILDSAEISLSDLVDSADSAPIDSAESAHTNSKVNTNNTYIQNNLQEMIQNPAKKNGDQMRTKEEINAATEAALLKSYTNPTIGYAQLPADIVEISAKVCELWYFKAPTNRKKLSFWIQSCRDLQDACAEFKLHLLDLLHNDWMLYINSHPCAPHTASGPQSLVKDAEAKAALLRSGNNSPMWGSKQKTTSKLDV